MKNYESIYVAPPPKSHPFHWRQRYWFGLRHINNGNKVMDYGCGDGYFLQSLNGLMPIVGHGVDLDADLIRRSQARVPEVRFHALPKDLPWPNESFDVITMFDVLEHIHDQDSVLDLVFSMLKHGGTLIVTVPRQHIFSFLDPGNFKFRWPRLNRLVISVVKGREYYRKKFTENPYGMIGDIEAAKGWHEHFTYEILHRLLAKNGFTITEVSGSGLFANPLGIIQQATRIPLSWLRLWDANTFRMQMLYVAAKKK